MIFIIQRIFQTKRFIVQLAQPLGFTGWGFFRLGKRYVIAVSSSSLNKTFFLSFMTMFVFVYYIWHCIPKMSGTILTYEVVLLDMTKPRQTNIVINNLTKTT